MKKLNVLIVFASLLLSQSDAFAESRRLKDLVSCPALTSNTPPQGWTWLTPPSSKDKVTGVPGVPSLTQQKTASCWYRISPVSLQLIYSASPGPCILSSDGKFSCP